MKREAEALKNHSDLIKLKIADNACEINVA